MYTWGGPFFMISGCCYVLLDMGIPGLWLGTFPSGLQTQFSADAFGFMVPYLCSALHLLLWLCHNPQAQGTPGVSLTMNVCIMKTACH